MKRGLFGEKVYGIASVSHYHQSPGLHPTGQIIPKGYERVELMTAGRGWVEEEGDWVELRAGDLIWQCPGDQTISRSDFEDPYRCLSLNFEVGERTGRRVRRITRWPDLAAVRAFTDEVVDLWIRRAVPNDILTAYAFGRLFIQARLGERQTEASRLPLGLQRAQDHIEQHYAKTVSIGQLARAAECSGPHLHDLYRRHLGQSPHQVLVERRLQQACRRLSSTRDPIKQIALEVGFSTAAAFSHAFKRYAGQTPADYRRRSQQIS